MTDREWKLSNQKGQGRNEAWLRAHVGYRHNDCLKWPFGKDTHGYGQLKFDEKIRKAHRVMCQLVHGPAPAPGYEAAHSCGRGHQGCINPRHLSWKTRSENQRDRTDDYNRGAPRYKLSEDDVAQIRILFTSETNLSIARRFDVTPGLISKIRNGHLWGNDRKRTFVRVPDEKVQEIRRQFESMSAREIAEIHGLPINQVYHIKTGRSHGYVP
jgi:hypothetical protein